MKYTGLSVLIYLFVLMGAAGCSDEAEIGHESASEMPGKIVLSLPHTEVVQVRSWGHP